MYNRWSADNYKIGFSKDPSRRGVEVKDTYEVDLKIISSCWFTTQFDARAAEKHWHRYFSDNQTIDHGGKEWFALSTSDVQTFTSWSALSPNKDELLDNLFKGHLTTKQVKDLTDKLFNSIPRRKKPDSIDVWRSPHVLKPLLL
jgi:hypothetical protein